MPTEQEFQALLKRIEALETFKDEATQGLLSHKDSLDSHAKTINDIDAKVNKVANMTTQAFDKLTTYFNRQR